MATKLEKHLNALAEETTGGSHDAVTFSGKGLGFLKDLFKSAKKRDEDDYDDDDMDDELEADEEMDGDDERDDDEERNDEEDDKAEDDQPKRHARKSRRVKKSTRRTRKARRDEDEYDANGGDLEDVDYEDDEDPGQEGDEEIITNHGRRVNAREAVRKHFDRYEEEYSDVLDASDALREMTNNVRRMNKSMATMDEIRILAKGMQAILKGQAALAKDIETIKRQPGTNPASGFVVLTKNSGRNTTTRKLSKSDIADVVNDAMLEGLIDAKVNSRLGVINSPQELQQFVDSLPASVRERL